MDLKGCVEKTREEIDTLAALRATHDEDQNNIDRENLVPYRTGNIYVEGIRWQSLLSLIGWSRMGD